MSRLIPQRQPFPSLDRWLLGKPTVPFVHTVMSRDAACKRPHGLGTTARSTVLPMKLHPFAILLLVPPWSHWRESRAAGMCRPRCMTHPSAGSSRRVLSLPCSRRAVFVVPDLHPGEHMADLLQVFPLC